jgi:hypothetical protein
LAELKSCHIFVEQNKTTMTITKTDRSEMLQNVIEEFKSFGFVNSPKEPENNNFLYAASKVYKKEDTGILIHISSITDKNVYLEVYDMVNNGMSFGEKHHKFAGTVNGTTIKWDYTKRSFGRFFMTTYINRVHELLYKK